MEGGGGAQGSRRKKQSKLTLAVLIFQNVPNSGTMTECSDRDGSAPRFFYGPVSSASVKQSGQEGLYCQPCSSSSLGPAPAGKKRPWLYTSKRVTHQVCLFDSASWALSPLAPLCFSVILFAAFHPSSSSASA